MPVKLRNEEGYYSREMTIEGSKFYVRDLGEHYDEFIDRNAVIAAESGIVAEGLDMATMLARVIERTAAPDAQHATRRRLEEFFDWLLEVGLVKWNLPPECIPENTTLLPARLKSELGRAIVAESDLSLQEGNFLDRLGARPAR